MSRTDLQSKINTYSVDLEFYLVGCIVLFYPISHDKNVWFYYEEFIGEYTPNEILGSLSGGD